MTTIVARLGRSRRWNPHWPFVLGTALVWAALAAGQLAATWSPSLIGPGRGQFVCSIALSPDAVISFGGPGAVALMAGASMLPVSFPWIRHVGINSLVERQVRSMLIFVTAYVAIWAVLAIAALWLWSAVAAQVQPAQPIALALALVAAAAWHASPARRAALARCAWTLPLPPVGLRADLGALRFGIAEGVRCLTTGWALMLVMIVGGLGFAPMAALAVLAFVEQWTAPGWRLMRASAVGLAGLSAFVLVSGPI